MNPFVLSVGILQILGAIYYFAKGGIVLGVLYFLYGLTNITILFLKIQ